MGGFERGQFDHIGVVTEEHQHGETWVEATRVWVTNPRAHSHHVEFLRFEPDTPVTTVMARRGMSRSKPFRLC